MVAVTAGQLLERATGHVEEAARAGFAGRPGQLSACALLAGVLARWSGDASAAAAVPGPWDTAAAEAAGSLARAARYLGATPDGPPDGPLAAAAQEVAAARDLLRAHDPSAGDVRPAQVMSWHRIAATGAVRAAMTSYAADTAASLSAWLGSIPPSAVPPGCDVRRAAASLMQAQSAALHAESELPVTAAGRAVLAALPAPEVPAARPLPGRGEPAEPPPQLCQGAAVSAARLRAAARASAAHATWSPQASTSAWRWTSVYAAITCDLGEILLREVARLPPGPGVSPPGPARVAAQALADARSAWRTASGSWQQLSTEATAEVSPALPEARDLVARLGKLVFADPDWTPAAARRPASARPPLPPGLAAPAAAAFHEAAEALADMAAYDLSGIEAAWRASRFYAPRRAPLPSRTGPGRLFTPAHPLQVAEVTRAYRSAVRASGRAALAMGALAREGGLTTGPLSQARTLSRQRPPAPRPQPAGAVELTITGLTADQQLLARAAALDEAVTQLASTAAAIGFPDPVAAATAAPPHVRRTMRQALGTELRALRAKSDLSVTALAAAAGTTATLIANIEGGLGAADASRVQRIAQAAGAPDDVVHRLRAMAEAGGVARPARPTAGLRAQPGRPRRPGPAPGGVPR